MRAPFALHGSAMLVEKVFTWHRPIFSGGYPPTIVGAAAFHSRVRDGIGVVPLRHGHQERKLPMVAFSFCSQVEP